MKMFALTFLFAFFTNTAFATCSVMMTHASDFIEESEYVNHGYRWSTFLKDLHFAGIETADDIEQADFLVAADAIVIQRNFRPSIKWVEVVLADKNGKVIHRIKKKGRYNEDNREKAFKSLARKLNKKKCR